MGLLLYTLYPGIKPWDCATSLVNFHNLRFSFITAKRSVSSFHAGCPSSPTSAPPPPSSTKLSSLYGRRRNCVRAPLSQKILTFITVFTFDTPIPIKTSREDRDRRQQLLRNRFFFPFSNQLLNDDRNNRDRIDASTGDLSEFCSS